MIDRFVVVMPVYEDASSARRLMKELAAGFGQRIYIIAVDDGSVREPVELLWMSEHDIDGMVLTLTQNMGHQKAIAIGLCYAAEHFPGQSVVTMDADGEDTPASIRHLLSEAEKDGDIVVAQRRQRAETAKFKLFYALYKQVFKLLSGRSISFGNFALYSPAAVARLSKMSELWIHIAATVLRSKLGVTYVSIDRGPRYDGQSKMNFVALVLHGFRGLMVFAEDVLVRVGIFCGIVALLAMFGVALAIFLKFIGLSTPGWFSVIVGVLLLIMFQTGILALTTLLLTGVMKGILNSPPDYRLFIKEVQAAHPAAGAVSR